MMTRISCQGSGKLSADSRRETMDRQPLQLQPERIRKPTSLTMLEFRQNLPATLTEKLGRRAKWIGSVDPNNGRFKPPCPWCGRYHD